MRVSEKSLTFITLVRAFMSRRHLFTVDGIKLVDGELVASSQELCHDHHRTRNGHQSGERVACRATRAAEAVPCLYAYRLVP